MQEFDVRRARLLEKMEDNSIALIFSGVLPSISLASYPVAIIELFFSSIAITDGSLKTIPFKLSIFITHHLFFSFFL